VPGAETFLAGVGGFFVHNTFTIANIVAQTQRPALVMAHNKTLAAQLYAEFKGFFPKNAVEYFVSYYDYYQPRLTSRSTICTSKRKRRSTKRSSACGWRPPLRCSRAAT